MSRREFTPTQRREIVTRAKRGGRFIHCEGCGQVLGAKRYEIDHIIPEGLRPEADKQRKITIAEGQLLGTECCHRGENGKTKKDQRQIAKSNRQFDKSQGLKRPKQPIPGRGFPKSEKSERRQAKPQLSPRSLFEAKP
ncbi:hypothetical protein [Rhizobium sp. LCM 4573]|uniref:hypothetical protein n=1 Tax=Rhizobium sp. LCM 4573 TaxID=1848291 RepID=UPI0008D90742|nr:hypothetical protein [Rhizobium sp. LCM 4573]OHV81661.1 hypothetical protein LCM4573_21510 [Rhizobium sp. LCM 4573]